MQTLRPLVKLLHQHRRQQLQLQVMLLSSLQAQHRVLQATQMLLLQSQHQPQAQPVLPLLQPLRTRHSNLSSRPQPPQASSKARQQLLNHRQVVLQHRDAPLSAQLALAARLGQGGAMPQMGAGAKGGAHQLSVLLSHWLLGHCCMR